MTFQVKPSNCLEKREKGGKNLSPLHFCCSFSLMSVSEDECKEKHHYVARNVQVINPNGTERCTCQP